MRCHYSVLSYVFDIFAVDVGKTGSLAKRGVRNVLRLVSLTKDRQLDRSNSANSQLGRARTVGGDLDDLNSIVRSVSGGSSRVPFQGSGLACLLRGSLNASALVGMTSYFMKKGYGALVFIGVSPSVSGVKRSLYSLEFTAGMGSYRVKATQEVAAGRWVLLN